MQHHKLKCHLPLKTLSKLAVFSTAFILSALQHQSSTTNPVIHWLKETESLLPSVKTSLTPFILSTNIPMHSSYSSVLSGTEIINNIKIIQTSRKLKNIERKPIKKLNSTNGMHYRKTTHTLKNKSKRTQDEPSHHALSWFKWVVYHLKCWQMFRDIKIHQGKDNVRYLHFFVCSVFLDCHLQICLMTVNTCLFSLLKRRLQKWSDGSLSASKEGGHD